MGAHRSLPIRVRVNAHRVGERLSVGKGRAVQRKARMGRNPATGEAFRIPVKKVVKFRVAKAAKDAILG